MLAVILKILSVLGIVLLCLLGLILFVAVLILVMPVTYRIKAAADEDVPVNAEFKGSYFLGLVRAFAKYEKVLDIKVRILWFTLFQMTIPDGSDDEDGDGDMFSGLDDPLDELFADELDEDGGSDGDGSDGYDPGLTEGIEGDPDNGSDADNESNDLDNDAAEADTASEGAGTEEKGDDISGDTSGNGDGDSPDETGSGDETGSDDVDSGDEEKENIFDKIKYKLSGIYDKIQDVRSEIRYYRNVWNSNEAKNALRVIKKRLLKILKKILPRRISADVTYGFSSPDMTGKVFGIYCLIRKRFDKKSVVIPDFDRQVFIGKVSAFGMFNLWGILINLICIVLNRNVLKIFKSVRRHLGKKKKAAEELDRAA